MLSEISQTEYVRQRQNSNMQNVAISRCCFATFCNQRQRNEQRIITYAYTATALVAVAVKVCLIKLSKTE